MPDYIIVDTEGKHDLKEIAVLDSTGHTLYEAFAREHPNNYGVKANLYPVKEILNQLFELAHHKVVIFHNASHDIALLRKCCEKHIVPWQSIQYKCTYTLAKAKFPNAQGYSLEYLSQFLYLRHQGKLFKPNYAHTAKYDAQFTRLLYLAIMQKDQTSAPSQYPNPFGSNRVDNPFQNHPDSKSTHQNEFELLRSIISDIRQDQNRQSRGAVVIGNAGTGKTHLIMRLAHEVLKVNRVLFIRQPNNPDTVLFHIYTRILESFMERVPENKHTQLENLLANSFVKLISQIQHINLTQKDQDILKIIHNDSLDIYEGLGAEGTQKKRAYWQHIERRATEWWRYQYGAAGYAEQVIRGIIKFCSYTEPNKKRLTAQWLAAQDLSQENAEEIGLPSWGEILDRDREGFSLEAISVFSKLSILDEPLIIVFDQLEGLSLDYNHQTLLSFGEAIREIFTHVPNSLIVLNLFPDRWKHFQKVFESAIVDRIAQNQIYLKHPSKDKLKEILNLRLKPIGVNFNDFFSDEEIDEILKPSSIRASINKASDYYRQKKYIVPDTQTHTKAVSKKTSPGREDTSVEERLNNLETKIGVISNALATCVDALKSIHTVPIPPASYPSSQPRQDSSKPVSTLKEYLHEQKRLLNQKYEQIQTITDSNDIGMLTNIVQALISCKYPLSLKPQIRRGRAKLPDHILVECCGIDIFIGFLELDGNPFTARIKNLNEIVLDLKETNFIIWRDLRQQPISGKRGKEEIQKLNNASNGFFHTLEKKGRIEFELMSNLIAGIHNKDLDVPLDFALDCLISRKDGFSPPAILNDLTL